jgi:hypothetical protein
LKDGWPRFLCRRFQKKAGLETHVQKVGRPERIRPEDKRMGLEEKRTRPEDKR